MPLSNSQFNAVMRIYNKRQFQDKREQDERVSQVYEKIPVLRELEGMISTKAVSCAKRLLDGDKKALTDLKDEIADLKEQRSILLHSAGFPEDYMEMHYYCADCCDTGYIDRKKCHCFRKEEMNFLYSQSNIDEIIKKENFDKFSYRYFDNDTIEPVIGMTVRQYMTRVVELCKRYIDRFPDEHGNLLFTGGTGVGKTYLTNCIAKELIDKYFSVVYLSAVDLFQVFSRNRFEYHTEEEIKDLYQHILDCDLLIIDDLGTELNNSFTSSQLFYCINERLLRKRGTIVSTNLSVNTLRDMYTDRVASRIQSEYNILPLYGEDLRTKIH